jgi:hypothetical protein
LFILFLAWLINITVAYISYPESGVTAEAGSILLFPQLRILNIIMTLTHYLSWPHLANEYTLSKLEGVNEPQPAAIILIIWPHSTIVKTGYIQQALFCKKCGQKSKIN